MHEAYEVIRVLKKLPAGLSIETISAYGDYLLAGTKSGNILYYRLVSSPPGSAKLNNNECDIQLLYTNKSFSKKNITQLEVVPDYQMLLCLADGMVVAFDLSQGSVTPICTLSKTKGAHLFSVNVQKPKTTGENPLFRLCVAIKKKLQFYSWKSKEFVEFSPDMSLCDIPRIIVWCAESLFIGYKSDYSLIKITGEPKDLFPTGSKQQEPLITLLPDDQLAVGRDEQTILIDSEGIPTMKYPIKWSEVPIALRHDSPYLIAVLPSCVEVRSIEPRIHVQTIDLQKVKAISQGKRGWVFIASTSDVWLLRAVHFSEQITKLLMQNQFELALCMAKMTDESELEKNQLMQRIENLHAFHLYRQRNFKEAMDIFYKLETDPSHVIGLFSDLLPSEYRNSFKYPDQLPILQGNDLENGLLALTEYLVQVRHKLKQDLDSNVPSMTAIMEGSKTIRSKKQLLQIIDTTLLKCYLQTNDALVASLLRVKDNFCHIDESERALKKHKKYSELIILYNKKGLHRKALELLMRQAKKPDSALKGHERTVHYLQHLGNEHLDLIFEFAKWVIKEYPEDGLKIFTEELTETEYLPRSQVLQYLRETVPDLVIPYLEHIIYNWDDKTKYFHNSLVREYCEKIKGLLTEYLDSLPEGQHPVAAGNEPGELGELRNKLTFFLQTSQHYTVENFPTHILNDGLYEEGAIIFGRLGRHEEALTIYTHILQDPKKAEQYCLNHYNKDKPNDQDVYLLLLKLYLAPSESLKLNDLTSRYMQVQPCQPNLEKALKILSDYSTSINPFKAVTILPPVVTINSIRTFLENVLHSTQSHRHSIQLIKSLVLAEHLQVKAQKIHCQSYKLIVTDLDICRVCQKRIGKSAFARFPTGVTVHYSCKEKYYSSV